jgi:hypothetical protein
MSDAAISDWLGRYPLTWPDASRAAGSRLSGTIASINEPTLSWWGGVFVDHTTRREFVVGSLTALGAAASEVGTAPAATAHEGLELATFMADITPPIGEPLCGGLLDEPARVIEHPLRARGVVLRDAGGTYVLCALDLCAVCNTAYDQLKRRLAEAAGTTPSRVAVQSLHQHSAGIIDLDAQRLGEREKGFPAVATPTYFEHICKQTAAALAAARTTPKRVTHVGTHWEAVDQLASTRRILQPDGTILPRHSATKDPACRRAPEGTIDGYLRTITFFDDQQPLASLHYYATHPMSYYGHGLVTYDVPGLALARREEQSGEFGVYFTGCAGDITMGKYNDGAHARRPELVDRLHDALARRPRAIPRLPVSPIRWTTTTVRFSPRRDPSFSEAACRQVLADTAAVSEERIKAAMNLAWLERLQAGHAIELSCLALGPIRILHLPGEPFVEYQLSAQRTHPDLFVAVAGYGDCAPWYICTDRAYTDRGGYEQTWSLVDPCEQVLKRAMAGLISGALTG